MPPGDPYVRSEEELAEYEALLARPEQEGLREFRRLFVEYATAQGGLTLEFWRLHRGPWFGEPQSMSLGLTAETLGITRAEVTRMLEDAGRALKPELEKLRPLHQRSRDDIKRLAVEARLALVQDAAAVVDEDPDGEGDQGGQHDDDAGDLDGRVET